MLLLLHEDGSSNFPGQRIVLLQEMMHSCLSRESAYSPVLLSEAVRDALSPEMAASLLRIFASILGGLCSDDAAAAISWSRWIVLDEHVKRAVSWMEAILDGHFSAIALNVLTPNFYYLFIYFVLNSSVTFMTGNAR